MTGRYMDAALIGRSREYLERLRQDPGPLKREGLRLEEQVMLNVLKAVLSRWDEQLST
jgi:hypothetical protein